MGNSKKEEERVERIIRGLLKLQENRRCINCNILVLFNHFLAILFFFFFVIKYNNYKLLDFSFWFVSVDALKIVLNFFCFCFMHETYSYEIVPDKHNIGCVLWIRDHNMSVQLSQHLYAQIAVDYSKHFFY